MRDAVTDVDVLWNMLKLPKSQLQAAHSANRLFQLKVPLGFIKRMEPGNLNDPLLRQILPLGAETVSAPNFSSDPVADLASNPIPGIIHKYHGRVLLITTGACAVHCRYCFRREFPYNAQTASRKHWDIALDYIQADETIHEVILSGGDPLTLSDDKLAILFDALNDISHVKTIRLHTRLPIVLPERIDQGFISALNRSQKNLVMVIHANHANEINTEVANAVHILKIHNVMILNQSVLLSGINSSLTSLIELSHALFDIGVLPYYLNILDKVSGSTHFEVEESQAQALHTSMRRHLPGYLVPILVKDIPDQPSKTWI